MVILRKTRMQRIALYSKINIPKVNCNCINFVVRGMRRYGKRRGVGGKPYNSRRGSRRASPSPTELSYKNEDKSEEAEEMDYLNNSKYRGHVFQTDKIG